MSSNSLSSKEYRLRWLNPVLRASQHPTGLCRNASHLVVFREDHPTLLSRLKRHQAERNALDCHNPSPLPSRRTDECPGQVRLQYLPRTLLAIETRQERRLANYRKPLGNSASATVRRECPRDLVGRDRQHLATIHPPGSSARGDPSSLRPRVRDRAR
jgi:hypothetical protein